MPELTEYDFCCQPTSPLMRPATRIGGLVLERAVDVELQVVVARLRRDLPVEPDGLAAIRIDDRLEEDSSPSSRQLSLRPASPLK